MRFLRLQTIFTLLILVVTASAQKRSITETDLFNFVWVGDPQISPDGSKAAFARVTVNAKKEGYDTSIWMVSTTGESEPVLISSGDHDSSPRWSPDGKYLVFTRVAITDGKPQPPQLFMLSMAGGDSFCFTDLPKGASQAFWSPDSKMIAFASDSNPADLQKAVDKPRPDGPDTEHKSDVHVVKNSVFRSNGSGYNDPEHPQHIWVVAAPRSAGESVTPKQLTAGAFDEDNFVWSKDGSQIYFNSVRQGEPDGELPITVIYSVSSSGGEPVELTRFEMGTGQFALSPDGRRIAFEASTNLPITSYTQPDLWALDLAKGSQPRNLTTGFDYDIGAGIGGDNRPPRASGGSSPIWTADGSGLIELYQKEGKANLAVFSAADGKKTDITQGNQTVTNFDSSADGSRMVYELSTPTRIGDLYSLERSSGQFKQLTRMNDKLFSQLNITEPEEIWYTSFDGKRIQGWLQKPPDFDPKKKYPLILNIHGGPHSAYGYVFDHEFLWMAAKGYVVLYPNPRGSTSYGQDFGNIIQFKYPGDDYKDLMAGVDETIRRGYIDTTKLGVTGGSGGGLLTDWTVGQTTRFAAAVSQRDIASWEDWWYTADFTRFRPNWFKAPPFIDPEDYKARSPITYITKVKTPLMLILGDADLRTPTGAGGEQMFRALKYLKVPTIMVRFPGETHELSRSGQPWHRIERLRHIVGWFDHWLMNVPKPEYDSPK